MQDAGHFACTVLCDLRDKSDSTRSKAPLSFSAWWLDKFRKQYHISHCRLQGEAGEVDLEAIEPELIEIRQLCAQYTPDNIFNCDETGMYVKELDTKSYTTPLSTSGAKAIRDCRVSVLFCINASGTSLAMVKEKKSLRPLVIGNVLYCTSDFCVDDLDNISFSDSNLYVCLLILGEHISRDVEKEAAAKMTMVRTKKGWMTREVFMSWLQDLDNDLDQPTLLLLDSAGSHNNIDMHDPYGGVPWKHLRIQRLPKNSTSVTQPLDAGVISAFKRMFLEMLGFETYYARNFEQTVIITNGHAWSLVPYAWDQMKPSILRNCFAKTPVLPTQMRDYLRQQQPTKDEQQQQKPRHTQHEKYKDQEKAYFEHIIAEFGVGNEVNFTMVESGEELARGALQQVDVDGGGYNTAGRSGDSLDEAVSNASSPISDMEIDTTIRTLKHLAGDDDFLTTDGIKRVRKNAKGGPRRMQELRKIVKQLVRVVGATEDDELDKNVPEGCE